MSALQACIPRSMRCVLTNQFGLVCSTLLTAQHYSLTAPDDQRMQAIIMAADSTLKWHKSYQHYGCMQTSVIIQITDDVKCITYDPTTGLETGVTPLFCTNVTQFQLDYRAFEQLAHPDYGLMNLRFR